MSKKVTEIDVSCDIGEGYGPYRIADDDALLRIVSSANLACGFHAGDPNIMTHIIAVAKELGVAVGAHVGKPDLAGFGRREIKLSAEEMYSAVLYQCGALALLCEAAEWPMRYVSFHGDLGSMIGRAQGLASRLMDVWSRMKVRPQVQGLPGTALLKAAEEAGLEAIPVFLADRGYSGDGVPVPRGSPGAVLDDLREVRRRIRQLIETGQIESVDGRPVSLVAKSIVIHSDTPGAVETGLAVRQELQAIGVSVRSPRW